MRLPALVLAGALALAGCAGGDERRTAPVDPDLEAHLDEARASPVPLYYAGRRAAGLDLTAVVVRGAGRAVFLYGTCELPRGEGGCSPPVQVQQFPFSGAQWRRASGCTRVAALRGLPTVRHDGLVLFTGRSVVKVYARSPQEERELALALRPVPGGDPAAALPPPPESVRALAARVCR